MVRLHHPKGHPYWQKNKYLVEVDNNFINPYKFWSKFGKPSEYEIFVENEGIFVQYFACGSGFGKEAISDKYLLVKCNLNNIEYIGDKLEMSNELQNELISLGHK